MQRIAWRRAIKNEVHCAHRPLTLAVVKTEEMRASPQTVTAGRYRSEIFFTT